ncbi:MAG: H+transporting two-sector ATPase subunit [Clostridia bacterium]|jgi:V/A-type H+-transporting ATPase subunit E|nr:H+transporting two-sector ATPase subunit [Clostridia bacterium]
MVTIEQKLTLFSKLLNQDIKEEVDKQLVELEKIYKQKRLVNQAKADKEAQALVENAIKRAETKKTELISKAKMCNKKECMMAKEAYIHTFIERLKDKIKDFTQTDEYKVYLDRYLMQFETLRGYENDLDVYITESDYNRHKEYIKEKLSNIGLQGEKLNFKIANDTILGGIIIEDPKRNMRIDTSILQVLEDAKNHIIEVVFGAIGEVGEKVE